MGAPVGPMGPTGPVACVSRGARDPPGCCFPKKAVFRQKTGILTLDLANGGSGATRDPINPLPRTWLYRIIRRRAHHLPPDPNIFGPKTQNLKIGPFSEFGQIPLSNE